MGDIEEFLTTLPGVDSADYRENQHREFIELTLEPNAQIEVRNFLTEGEWEHDEDHDVPGYVESYFFREKHHVEYMCVMTPHVVSDVKSPDPHDHELPDEETSQGYFREVVDIMCRCGEQFTGKQQALSDYKDHMPD